jgi:hypothetical protein
MTKVNSILDFYALLERVLGYWPESIDTSQLRVNASRPDLYVVIGLGDLGDLIAEKFSGEVDAVLVTALNDAITATVRSASLFSTEIKPKLLRPNTVRENFEKRLHRAITSADLGWSDEDILLIKKYFSMADSRTRCNTL